MPTIDTSMFRAYDIRTPAALLPAELAERLARAEAVYFRDVLGVRGVVVAHDARRTGPQYLTIAADAFCDAGLEVVYLPGACTASAFYFAAMCHGECAAVLIGASHNPADDTGQKILGPGLSPIARGIGPEGGLDAIRQLYCDGASCRGRRRGRVRPRELIDRYVAYSMELAGVAPDSLQGAEIFQDYVNGAAGREMMLAFDRAGAALTPMHFTPDGAFPLGDPNPVKEEVIRPGLDVLCRGAFLLGTFFDGDGDRIDFYRGDGAYLSSSFVYAAILPEICRRFSAPRPGDCPDFCGGHHAAAWSPQEWDCPLSAPRLGVFADLKSNPLAVMEMARAGVSVDVIRNGHSQIKQSLIDAPSHFGAVEESAHFYEAFSLDGRGRYCTENTLYIALLVARVWHEVPQRFAELFRLQATTAREREWGYKFPCDAARDAALQAVQEHFQRCGARALNRMKNGMDLEATLMRRGLPFDVDQRTRLADDWLQVCQRISQSEDGLARWEVVGATPELVREAKREIATCVAAFGAGEEYQG